MTESVQHRVGELPLAGIRVLSLAEQYPGPYATMILADLGADVILVERPNGGDPTRRFSGHFNGLNRNKRSVAIDLKSDQGKKILLELAATADVLIEGYRPGVLSRLGVGPETLQERYPRLVVCSVSSFGQTGPMGPRGGHDLSMQGIAGFVGGDPPAPAPLPLADLSSAMFAVIGIVTSLLDRARGREAAYIDISMLDALVSWRSTALVSSLNGLDPAPYPPDDPGYGVFEASTGQLITLSIAGEDHQWRALCETVGLLDLAELTTEAREAQAAEIVPRLKGAIRQHDWDKLEAELSRQGVGFGPVNDDQAVAEHPQVAAREVIVEVDDGSGLIAVAQPIKFDGKRVRIRSRAPYLGEHSRDLLTEIGYDDIETASLFEASVIAEPTKEQL
ncbi:CaiB/BaiF CoA transferase family protein [Rhodococcus qingshengii]|uniref:CaiB/BaiF CoA transferase family protein n=1 Tax=Rhodococcus qingshengii TaxID=334542 RepID=UPI00210C84E5|nr:CaiB/BaiF CoA-transferase family protein [Rhodococcus qingshengii]MCQ4150594.1 CoA transferase [Rhodococcus qingshengii]